MKPVPHGEPYAGKLHVRFDEGAGVPDNKGRPVLLYTLLCNLRCRLSVYYTAAELEPIFHRWCTKCCGLVELIKSEWRPVKQISRPPSIPRGMLLDHERPM